MASEQAEDLGGVWPYPVTREAWVVESRVGGIVGYEEYPNQRDAEHHALRALRRGHVVSMWRSH